jgi:ATP-dependent helicase/nuclease subunit A
MSRAADPNVSAWVSANAGAGKTQTLANRVTRLLLAGAPPERILCLTYTKAAAAEMAGRLFNLLGEWSMLPDAELSAKIAQTGAEPDRDLREARRLFAKALETPGGLKIQTIHSFCQYVLTRFPIEAGVPVSFMVLDERSAGELMAQAQARVLERAGSGDTQRAEAIAYLATHLSDMRLEQILDAALGGDRGKLAAFLDKMGGPENDWSRFLKQAHGARADDTTESIAMEFCEELARDDAVLRETIAGLSDGSKGDADRGAALAAAREAPDALERYEGFCEALLTKDGTVRKILATKPLADARPKLAAFLQRLGERLLGCRDRQHAVEAAALAEAALTVVEAVRDVYAAEKRARNALDYDDLIIQTHRLLQSGGAAWVQFKLDEGIDHILIDEAQDTSALQWDIIQSLTDEFFAGEGAERTVRTLFAVGDEKQSIFSFQGADPKQFDARRKFFEGRAAAGRRKFEFEPLIKSWRSAPEILAFVDAVFADPAARDGLSSEDVRIEHKALRDTAIGCVEFWPALKPSQSPDDDPWDLRPVDREPEASPVVRLAEQIAGRIKDWLLRGATLPGHDEPITPGDIMILLPRREPFGSEIIRRLKARGVPVAGADRIALAEQIVVMDLIALGRFALLPEDDLNLAALLRSPLIGLAEDELFEMAHARRGSLWHAVQESRFTEALEILTEARKRADFAPPFEFFAQALIDGRQKLLKRLGTETNDPIDEFLSLALLYENANTPSLEGFLHWIERGGAEIKRDMERGRNEVRVMTVHGAKGLEADIVILPDTTRLPGDPTGKGHLLYVGDGVLFPTADNQAPESVRTARAAAKADAEREHRRLLYVALTRARDRLIICGFENSRGTKPGSWHSLAQRAALALGTENHAGACIYGTEALTSTATAPADAAEPFVVPDWALTPAKEERPAPWLIRPSQAAGVDEPAPPSPLAPEQRYRRGLLVHAMLARLPEIAPAQREDVARRFLLAHKLDDKACNALIAETLAVLDHPDFAPAFAPASRAEVSLVADLPELGAGARVHGRVDRLVVTDDEVLIVDFKTGTAQDKNVPPLYATQMALYRAAAARIFPGRRIACALVWTAGPALTPLGDALLDAETRRIRARLDRGVTGS